MRKRSLLPVLICLGMFFSINMLMVSSLAPSVLAKQLVSWLIGAVLFFIGLQINSRQISSSKTFVFIASCIALFLPIILNNITRGSRRWIELGFLSFQPSEFVKPWLMLFLVNTNFPLLLFIPVGIIMLQPDLGSAISVMLLIVPIVLYNFKLARIFAILGLVALILSPIIWSKVFHEYQRNRVIHFLNPGSDPLGKGYNVIQSKIAIGSGGLWGKGYRKGSQGQLLFLPEKHTDFMFAATAEELGFIGVAIILGTYFLLLKSLLDSAFSLTHNRQLMLFTLGNTFQIWSTAFINIGMNVGILPVTGIPLPFLSVGGSSLMALMFSLGVIHST